MPSLPRSLYVHIPFCRDVCSYCDFCKLIYKDAWARDYLPALFDEIRSFGIAPKSLRTIYVGGGTPTSLADPLFSTLLEGLAPLLSDGGEFTVEANPDSLTQEKCTILAKNRVNRVSIGVQTFSPRLLTLLRRHHTPDAIKQCLAMLANVGISNVTVDFMYALPGETKEEFESDLVSFLQLDVPHISTYSLILESGSMLGVRGFKEAPEDVQADMYERILAAFRKAGYRRYEVSNFAKRGKESRHNQTYWKDEEYYGAGLGASGYVGGVRYSNVRSLPLYIKNARKRESEEIVQGDDELRYYLLTNLRLEDGFGKEDFQRRFGMSFEEKCKKAISLCDRGLLRLVDDRWACTDRGMLLLDSVLVDLFPENEESQMI